MATKTQTTTVGQLLAEARERHGHSLRRAGMALGITDRMYKQWEQNFATPEWERADAIADYTDVSRATVLQILGVLTEDEAAALDDYAERDLRVYLNSDHLASYQQPNFALDAA